MWWDYTLCLNTLKDLWMLECSASFFQPVAQCCSVFFLLFVFFHWVVKVPWVCLEMMESKGPLCSIVQSVCVLDILKWFLMSRCPEGRRLATEMGYRAKVKPDWLDQPQQQWSVYTWGLSGWKKHATIYTSCFTCRITRHCTVSPGYLVPVTWLSFPQCFPVTCLLPVVSLLFKVQQK